MSNPCWTPPRSPPRYATGVYETSHRFDGQMVWNNMLEEKYNDLPSHTLISDRKRGRAFDRHDKPRLGSRSGQRDDSPAWQGPMAGRACEAPAEFDLGRQTGNQTGQPKEQPLGK